MTTHEAWFQDLIGADTKSSAAEKSRVSTSTLTHQLRNGHLSAATVVALARAYGRPVVKALAETGHIAADEASPIPIDHALQVAPDRKLLEEFARRLRMIRPEDRDKSLDDLAEVYPFPRSTPAEATPEQGKTTEATPSVRPTEYVADDTPTEPEMGDDDYHDGP